MMAGCDRFPVPGGFAQAVSPPRDAVADGHRRIRAVLRDFCDGPACTRELTEPATARGLVAFLRHELLPFARREERALPPGTEERETMMFEHAFLAAEIDALAAAVERSVCASGPDVARREAREVERRLVRIDVVLELHAARCEERAQTFRE